MVIFVNTTDKIKITVFLISSLEHPSYHSINVYTLGGKKSDCIKRLKYVCEIKGLEKDAYIFTVKRLRGLKDKLMFEW